MIEIKVNEQILPAQLATVFAASGIKRPVDDLDRLHQMLQHANLLITAWDGEKLVGVARSLTDYSYCCYLSDLAVDQQVQAKGIGRALIEETKKTNRRQRYAHPSSFKRSDGLLSKSRV
ncbi:GNAT family N-acetyltransferase [Geomicrobium sp. JCM 19055]|uniref:GNAT family N-acetyltransferase n=1 Tax=Geomicrobium sp. JCM 19055 TaxID=1460649 RepID=UPI00045ED685|nr:export cytoplasm protein SecA ATPase RNA helicase [Geomicrobium sp. JCM 19055]